MGSKKYLGIDQYRSSDLCLKKTSSLSSTKVESSRTFQVHSVHEIMTYKCP